MADSSISSPSLSASDESSELDAGCYSSSTTTAPPSLPDTADFSRSASDASSFSDHSGPFGAAAVSKLIAGRGSPAGAGASLRRLSMKPRADVLDRRSATAADVDELELVKERFSKLLLGEDMSGGGKGVCAAVAISNAITNLYATVFGSCCHRLEPLPEGKKAMWRREMDCLLSVCDHIVEFYPSSQALPDGTRVEVMATRPRSDIYINLPALEKLDAMLIVRLENPQFSMARSIQSFFLLIVRPNADQDVCIYVCAGDHGRVREGGVLVRGRRRGEVVRLDGDDHHIVVGVSVAGFVVPALFGGAPPEERGQVVGTGPLRAGRRAVRCGAQGAAAAAGLRQPDP